MHSRPLPFARSAHRVVVKSIAMLLGLLASTEAALGAPVVQQISGTLDHNASITITGSGFGSKATPAPLVWDNASGSKLSDKWSGGWPSMVPGYNIGYYSPMRGIIRLIPAIRATSRVRTPPTPARIPAIRS